MKRDIALDLEKKLEALFCLNPDLKEQELRAIYDMAELTPVMEFPRFANLAVRLIDAYLRTPQKMAERVLVEDYFEYLQRGAKKLIEEGELSKSRPKQSATQCLSLVTKDLYSPRDWCKLATKADIPMALVNAVDACQQRNRLIGSVLEYLFKVMLIIDKKAGLEWMLNYLKERSGSLDQDIVRDMLWSWQKLADLPKPALQWLVTWSGDTNLQRQWPEVSRKADILLRKHTLLHWAKQVEPKTSATRHLKFLLESGRVDDVKLQRWLDNCMVAISDAIEFFVNLTDELDGAGGEWKRCSIVQEIKTIVDLFEPMLILSDQVLSLPAGAYKLAMTFFGVIGSGRAKWEKRILRTSQNAIRRLFMRQLRLGKHPHEIIKHFSYGDKEFYNDMINQLDLLSEQFTSIEHREEMVKKLAVYYASFREPKLLAVEITNRYRTLMRMLHEDNLRRLLPDDLFCEVRKISGMQDLFSNISEARKFLDKRRDNSLGLDESLAIEMEYIHSIRTRRLLVNQKILF